MSRAVVPVVLCCVLLGSAAVAGTVPADGRTTGRQGDPYRVPPGLLIGAGVSALQAEGAWREEGKVESALEHAIHTPDSHYLGNADVSADHFHRYAEDLALAKQMKLKSHRFSISWSRIFKEGNTKQHNELGLRFYHKYIDEVRKNGMEPMVTMYHFDHPLSVELQTGGWTKSNMVDKFVEYADFLFREYGSRVKFWNPINEANMMCIFMLPELTFAKLNPVSNTTYYKCLHNTVLAHAKTYRLYKEKYFSQQQGKVGTSMVLWPASPASDKYEDAVAADVFNEVFAGTLVHPLVHGEYPASTRYLVDKRDAELGLTEPRLPHFTLEQRAELFSQGPATDFVGINVYNGYKVEYTTEPADFANVVSYLKPPIFDMPFVKIDAGGGFDNIDADLMKDSLLWAWNKFHLPIVITENGLGDSKGQGVRDTDRAAYLSANLRSLMQTVNEYQVPVISYYAWSLIDVFEFSGGYTKRPFGLIHVDYANGTLARTIKDSSKLFVELARTGTVPYIAPVPESPSTQAPSTQAPSSANRFAPGLVVLVALLVLAVH